MNTRFKTVIREVDPCAQFSFWQFSRAFWSCRRPLHSQRKWERPATASLPSNAIRDCGASIPAAKCHVADGAGKCVAETGPACIEMHAPVCACPVGDKPAVEYSNDSFRKVAKAQLDHVGSCGGSK